MRTLAPRLSMADIRAIASFEWGAIGEQDCDRALELVRRLVAELMRVSETFGYEDSRERLGALQAAMTNIDRSSVLSKSSEFRMLRAQFSKYMYEKRSNYR